MDPFRSLTLRLLMPADARTPADRPRPFASNTPTARAKAAAAKRSSAAPASPPVSTLVQLTGLVGGDAASRLVAAFGGTRIYVPQSPAPADTLSAFIGHPAAVALAQIYGGDRLEVPNPPPRRVQILELRASGLSIDAIALSLHCTRRRVFQVMAEARALAPAASRPTRKVRHPPAP
jgi:hypothetical protein